jgi:NAD(P)-dependent dehydrogenase (short-subunit alcohol dehydrogenase family)
MYNKTAIITGGSNGIGLEISRGLLSRNYRVVIVGRKNDKFAELSKQFPDKNLDFVKCDLSDAIEISYLIKELKKIQNIDLLINNAGALFVKRELNGQGIEKTFALNHLAYVKLTLGLINNLRATKQSKIINVASNAHKRYLLDSNDLENSFRYNGWKAYCRSKLLNILFTYALARRLGDSNITCNCFHPGFINSNFGNNNKDSVLRFFLNILKKFLAKNSSFGAKTAIYLASNVEISHLSGNYFYNCKPIKSSEQSYDIILQELIWKKTLVYLRTFLEENQSLNIEL